MGLLRLTAGARRSRPESCNFLCFFLLSPPWLRPRSSLLVAMSQTYMHYSTSSSLPSDYALLSRYAAARGLDENANTIASDEEIEANNHDAGEPSDASLTHQRVSRRSSFPTPFIRPLNPTIASRPDTSVAPVTLANEYTPLLVPRIEEEGDDLPGAAGEHTPRSLFWEELRILMKYTLPVYGFVPTSIPTITILT